MDGFIKRRSGRRWLAAGSILCAVWIVAFAGVLALRTLTVTAETIIEQVELNPLSSLSPSEREAFLETLADRINRLDLEERTRLRQSGVLEEMFEELSDQEKVAFLEATLPRGMQQMMEALNEMDPEERRRVVERALRSLRRASPEEISSELEDVHSRMIVEEGLKAYFEVATSETKLEVAPLIEHLQHRLQRVN